MNNIEVGDMIRVDRIGYQHVGVYVGPREFGGSCVVHNDKFKGVVLSSWNDFSDGKPVFIHKKATGDYRVRESIANRALSRLGQKFDLLTFNCEHAANWAQSGKSENPQLRGAFALVLCLVGLFALTRKG